MAVEDAGKLKTLVQEALDASKDVEEEELRKIAFDHVLRHLLGSGYGNGRSDARPPAVPEGDRVEPGDSSLASEQQRVDAAAHYFGIDPDQVFELFDLAEDAPKLVLSLRKLRQGKAAAVREIALLVCGVRTAVGLETTTDDIREIADEFGKIDSKHFMETINQMEEVVVRGKPRSHRRTVRMRVTGAEAASQLAQRLVA